LKKFQLTLITLLVASCSKASFLPKYKYGDCITPTDTRYSWYGKYAKVEAYVRKADGVQGSAYVLWFPDYDSSTNFYEKEIESSTKKVSYLEHCGIPK